MKTLFKNGVKWLYPTVEELERWEKKLKERREGKL
jgi:hypothetical protein